jgi:hypothetical protein
MRSVEVVTQGEMMAAVLDMIINSVAQAMLPKRRAVDGENTSEKLAVTAGQRAGPVLVSSLSGY